MSGPLTPCLFRSLNEFGMSFNPSLDPHLASRGVGSSTRPTSCHSDDPNSPLSDLTPSFRVEKFSFWPPPQSPPPHDPSRPDREDRVGVWTLRSRRPLVVALVTSTSSSGPTSPRGRDRQVLPFPCVSDVRGGRGWRWWLQTEPWLCVSRVTRVDNPFQSGTRCLHLRPPF